MEPMARLPLLPPHYCYPNNCRRERRRPIISIVVIPNRIHLFLVLGLLLLNILTSGSALSPSVPTTTTKACAPTSLSSWLQPPARPGGNNYLIRIRRTSSANTRENRFLLNSLRNNNISEDDTRSKVLSSSETALSKSPEKTNASSSSSSPSLQLTSNTSSKFGDSVPYTPASSSSPPPESTTSISNTNSPNKILIAITSFLLAILNYTYQFTHPTTAITLLSTMEQHSASLLDIGSNGKPTVIDFWAPWCTNCRIFAPTLYAVEHEYQDRINFIVVNGDDARNYPLVQLLGVDAIPHVALLDSEGDVETALIGPISRRVLRADLDALLNQRQLAVGVDCGGTAGGIAGEATAANTDVASQPTAITSTTIVCHDDLPYKMYDAFGYRPEDSRRIRFR